MDLTKLHEELVSAGVVEAGDLSVFELSCYLDPANRLYLIENLKTGKAYVGYSQQTLKKRFSQHKGCLRYNKYIGSPLQASWNKYVPEFGEDVFKFYPIMEFKDEEQMFRAEQVIISYLKLLGLSYNAAAGGKGCGKSSEEIRANMSRAQRKQRAERPVSDETRRRLSESHMGIVYSEERTRKIVAYQEKMKTIFSKGYKCSPEEIEIRKQRWQDPEFRERMLAARARKKAIREGTLVENTEESPKPTVGMSSELKADIEERQASRNSGDPLPEYKPNGHDSKEYRDTLRTRTTAMWENPELRKKASDGMKLAWIERRKRMELKKGLSS